MLSCAFVSWEFSLVSTTQFESYLSSAHPDLWWAPQGSNLGRPGLLGIGYWLCGHPWHSALNLRPRCSVSRGRAVYRCSAAFFLSGHYLVTCNLFFSLASRPTQVCDFEWQCSLPLFFFLIFQCNKNKIWRTSFLSCLSDWVWKYHVSVKCASLDTLLSGILSTAWLAQETVRFTSTAHFKGMTKCVLQTGSNSSVKVSYKRP